MSPVYIKQSLPDIIYISNIVTIHYIELPKDYIGYQDNHDFWEICYLDKGDIEVNYDGKEILQKQGELFFIEPNKEHSHRANGAVAPNLFVISFDCRSASMKHIKNKTIEASGAVKKIIKKLISESEQAFYMPICEPSLSIMKKQTQPSNRFKAANQELFGGTFDNAAARHELN